MTCHWCQCDAATSRDGQPTCWWHADQGLDDVPCETCGDGTVDDHTRQEIEEESWFLGE